jgi:hypothetical protein
VPGVRAAEAGKGRAGWAGPDGTVAALVRAGTRARHAGGDLLLAAPQHQVLRVLAVTRLPGVFSVHPRVEQAVASARFWQPVTAPAASRVALLAAT